MWKHEVLIDLYEENPEWYDHRETWERFVDKYWALSIGHEKTRNTSLIFVADKPLKRGELQKELD